MSEHKSFEERIDNMARTLYRQVEWRGEEKRSRLRRGEADDWQPIARIALKAFLEGKPVDQVDWKKLTDGIESMLDSPTADDILLLIERCTVRLEVSEDEYKGEVLRQLASTSEGSTVYGTDTRFQNIEWEER